MDSAHRFVPTYSVTWSRPASSCVQDCEDRRQGQEHSQQPFQPLTKWSHSGLGTACVGKENVGFEPVWATVGLAGGTAPPAVWKGAWASV